MSRNIFIKLALAANLLLSNAGYAEAPQDTNPQNVPPDFQITNANACFDRLSITDPKPNVVYHAANTKSVTCKYSQKNKTCSVLSTRDPDTFLQVPDSEFPMTLSFKNASGQIVKISAYNTGEILTIDGYVKGTQTMIPTPPLTPTEIDFAKKWFKFGRQGCVFTAS